MQVFGVAQVPATLGLTLYVAGYGLGPIIWSPMSEIPQLGRLWVYIGTLRKSRLVPSLWISAHSLSSRLRLVPDSHGASHQLRHAHGFPFPYRFLWVSGLGNWWCDHRRHVSTSKAGLWSRYLGYRCSVSQLIKDCKTSANTSQLWTSLGSSGWRLRCHGQGMDVDHMGTHVVVRLLPCLPILPSPRDELAQHHVP